MNMKHAPTNLRHGKGGNVQIKAQNYYSKSRNKAKVKRKTVPSINQLNNK